MSGFYDSFRAEAKKKLDEGVKEKLDNYGEAMKSAVRDALAEFCEQDGEFAQAVVQGGSFKDCMSAVRKCVKGNAISDMEAFGAAVRYYFPGAGIDIKMTINLGANVEKTEHGGIVIDLSSFF